MRNLALLLLIFTAGCATRPPPEVKYIPVPAGYLEPCELPAMPESNAELSDAFVVTYQCAEQGNKDKERIRNLPRD